MDVAIFGDDTPGIESQKRFRLSSLSSPFTNSFPSFSFLFLFMYSLLVPELDSIFVPVSESFEPAVTCVSLFGLNPFNCCLNLNRIFPFIDRIFRSFGRLVGLAEAITRGC